MTDRHRPIPIPAKSNKTHILTTHIENSTQKQKQKEKNNNVDLKIKVNRD